MCAEFNSNVPTAVIVEDLQLMWSGRVGDYEHAAGRIRPTNSPRVIVAPIADPELETCYWTVTSPRESSLAPIKGFETFNAKSETVTTSKLYGPCWEMGWRCVFPVTSFTEWRGPKGAKERLLIAPPAQTYYFIAGLYSVNKAGGKSCTMFTTAPNEFMTPIHRRMPAILKDWRAWLDPDTSPPDALAMLEPWTGELAISAIEPSSR